MGKNLRRRSGSELSNVIGPHTTFKPVKKKIPLNMMRVSPTANGCPEGGLTPYGWGAGRKIKKPSRGLNARVCLGQSSQIISPPQKCA